MKDIHSDIHYSPFFCVNLLLKHLLEGTGAFANLYRWLCRETDPETSWLCVGFCMDVLFLWFLPPHGSCLIY